MNEQIIEALKIIIAKSPNTAENAIRAIEAARNKSPVLNIRYNQCLIQAYANDGDKFTADERALLASAIEGGSDNRDYTLRVRLTEDERAQLQAAADALGQSLSEYVRRSVLGKAS